MESLSYNSLESVFSEPFSDKALAYAEVISSSIFHYHQVLEYVSADILAVQFDATFQDRLMHVVKEYGMLRTIILRDELELCGVYRQLMEQEAMWLSVMDFSIFFMLNALQTHRQQHDSNMVSQFLTHIMTDPRYCVSELHEEHIPKETFE